MGMAAAAAEPVRFVPFHDVRMEDTVWRPRIRQLVRDTLPHALRQTEVAQERLRLCAEWLESGGTTPKPEPHRFNTSDLYKVMEGAALMIRAEPNSAIEVELDRIIDLIARAQKDDGYLYVSHITGSIYVNEMGPRPYSYVLHSHELYNMGHLYEAAVAYARATGKTRLLDVAEKHARHVNRVFFEGDPAYNDGRPVLQAPGHQEIELGLIKLHDYTGNPLYLAMAKRFLDIRGVTYVPDGEGVNSPAYAQQHRPVAEQTEAVGHAVRATYQYAAMAEVDSLLGSDDFSRALDGIWHNIVDTKMHITGGLGAVHGIEGFGPSYLLPNQHTYLETCAAVGNVFFNLRMFLKHRDARYIDVAEIALLNNCLSGIGLDGTSFFYPNPLEAEFGHRPRSGWFGTACCPANIARLIPQVSGAVYAASGRDLYGLLYGANHASVTLGEGTVSLRQETDYPYEGDIRLSVDPEKPMAFALRLRIPTWAGKRLVPGDLYAYTESGPAWTMSVNGDPVEPDVTRGFAVLDRTWRPGDRVDLRLPMPVKANTCLEVVEANRGRVAFSRGPLVFCAEGVDNGGAVQRFFVEPVAALQGAHVQPVQEGMLRDLPVLLVPAREKRHDGIQAAPLTLIPYFAWSNRDRSSMITWLGTREDLARLDPRRPENMKFAAVSASHTFENDTVDAIRMRSEPESSFDTTIPRWTSWPHTGEPQWVEIRLNEPARVASIGLYFYDDHGGVQVPGRWSLEVPAEDDWAPLEIYNTDAYTVLPDNYNTVHPASPLRIDRLRIVLEPQHGKTSVGLLSVNVETQ